DAVSILFSDIVGFTDLCSKVHPQKVCRMLDELYTVFDTLSSAFDVYKVGTIGDAYMIAGGIIGDKEAHATAHGGHRGDLGQSVLLLSVRAPHNGEALCIRIGIHSGPAMTGVLGTKMPKFCFFGDTVNTASRMESSGVEGEIQVSASTAALLSEQGYTP
ncbi:guanylate cyclase, partial [Baffinella frigidus]